MYTDGHTLSRHDALPIASLVGSTIPDGLKRVLGRLGYIVWGLWSALRFRPFEVILTYKDGRSQRFRALELRIANRSEEHTSELQSLMRISYAVFCLTKKNLQPRHTTSSNSTEPTN